MPGSEFMISGRPQLILLELLRKQNEVVKTSLLSIVPNSYSLERHLTDLRKHGLISIREEKIVRRTFYVSLTPKGRAVAEQLKRAEEAAKGVVIHEEEGRAEIPTIDAENWAKRFQEDTRGMSLLYHVNVFEDHITIGQEINGKTHITNIFVRVNGKGMMRLWCEEDESFDCIHVQYAWTLPKVQEMYANNVRDGKVKDKSEGGCDSGDRERKRHSLEIGRTQACDGGNT